MSEQAWVGSAGASGLTGLARKAGATPFAATVFLSAALVFLVQPMFAKMATPLLGGSPSVWNVSLVCFQAALLAGYLYAHALTRFVSRLRTQVLIHAVALALGALVLPMALSEALGPPDPHAPTLWLIGVFALSIAPPFAVMSATAPLIQAWYARSGRPDAADPYHLYAASNIGSLLGLALYPLAIEPLSALADQTVGWAFGYAALALLLVGSGLSAVLTGGDQGIVRRASRARTGPGWMQRLTWVALAFIPSSLLVGATTHISTDVASAPFLWAPPLMVYLLSFIVVFAKRPAISLPVASRLLPVAVAAAFLSLPAVTSFPIALDFFIQLVALFLASVVCHGVMVAKRPDAEHLTEFYLLMSLGGVLGGAFNALLVPVIFEFVLEYPLVLALSLLARPAGAGLGGQRGRVLLLFAGTFVAGAILIRLLAPQSDPVLFDRILLAMAVLCIILTRTSRVAPFVAAACAWSVGQVSNPIGGGLTERGFFGVVRVSEAAGARTMMHGTTLHGAQLLDPAQRLVPTTYYAPATPIGEAFAAYQGKDAVGVVGLGVGSVACYRQPGQTYVFYEIDPIVARLASDPAYFTYLPECAPDARVVLGDGRLTLAEEPEGHFGLLLIDAFSSDSVPAHLITREAVALYLSRLSDDGVLVMHVSNRHLALEAILARIAEAEGVPAYYKFFVPDVPENAEEPGLSPYASNASQVVVMARTDAALARYAADASWTRLESDGGRPWTDDYSNVIGAMIDKARAGH